MSLRDEQLISQYRALGDPKRFRLVQLLAEHGELTCGELADKLGLAFSTITHHTQVLMECGLIDVEPQGSHRLFRLKRDALDACAPAVLGKPRGEESPARD